MITRVRVELAQEITKEIEDLILDFITDGEPHLEFVQSEVFGDTLDAFYEGNFEEFIDDALEDMLIDMNIDYHEVRVDEAKDLGHFEGL